MKKNLEDLGLHHLKEIFNDEDVNCVYEDDPLCIYKFRI